jgi:hypothetical protein
VISSTVGWEAMMNGKPVIALGNVWWGSFDLVHHVDRPADLPRVLSRAINDFVPDPALLNTYVAAVLEGTYPGRVDNPDYDPVVISEANIREAANSPVKHISAFGSVAEARS